MISQRQAVHPVIFRSTDEPFDVPRSVEQAVVAMAMQVDERADNLVGRLDHFGHGASSLRGSRNGNSQPSGCTATRQFAGKFALWGQFCKPQPTSFCLYERVSDNDLARRSRKMDVGEPHRMTQRLRVEGSPSVLQTTR